MQRCHLQMSATYAFYVYDLINRKQWEHGMRIVFLALFLFCETLSWKLRSPTPNHYYIQGFEPWSSLACERNFQPVTSFELCSMILWNQTCSNKQLVCWKWLGEYTVTRACGFVAHNMHFLAQRRGKRTRSECMTIGKRASRFFSISFKGTLYSIFVSSQA